MRKKVLKIMSCFFAIMIGFTLLSRVIEKKNIAKVEVYEAISNEISHEIIQDGVISYDKEAPVFVESDYIVESIFVNEGQEIKEGDVLCAFSEEKLKEKQLECKRQIEKIELQIKGMKDQRAVNKEKFNQTLEAAKGRLNRVTDAENLNVSQKQEEYKQAEKEYEAYLEKQDTDEYEEDVASGLKKSVESAKAAYDSALQSKKDAIASAKEEVKSASISEVEDTSMEQLLIDQQALQEEQKKIENLLANSGKVVSKQAGIITEIQLQVGEASTQGAAFLIANESQGVKLELLLQEEELKTATTDSRITITGVNKNGETETRTDCQMSNIVPQEGEEKTYKVTFKIPENQFIVGSSVEVAIKAKSQVYDYCIPIQAIYPENEKEFYVYAVEQKSTMLGEIDIAKKVNVTILDRNDNYAAIEESIAGDIIIDTTRDLNDGDRIRSVQ